MLSIGAFARAAGLSAKALRLYADLELVVPARVDPVTGYRFYRPDQLGQARLVAWLRRLGMPLNQIQQVAALEPARAAEAIGSYWARVEADTAERRALARELVRTLSAAPLTMRYAAGSDIGRVRAENQDTSFAGERLIAVADGFGAKGWPASAAVVEALRSIEPGCTADLLNAMQEAVRNAGSGIEAGAGTTLTAMIWTGAGLALVHIGDSRAYVLRDGGLLQITHDHSVTQLMVDSGRLTPEEARSHPQQSLLVRALDGSAEPEVDARLQDVSPGERYLLCSDGLSSVVPTPQIREALVRAENPADAVKALLDRAYEAGAPDNVSCVVADIRELSP